MSSTIWIILGVIAFIIVLIIGLYNNLINLNQKVKNAWAQIDIQLTKRFNLIPNLVEIIKKYTPSNQNNLTFILEAKNKFITTDSIEEKINANNMLTSSLKSIFSLIDSNSELKANQAKLEANQEELKANQEKLSASQEELKANQIVMQYEISDLKAGQAIMQDEIKSIKRGQTVILRSVTQMKKDIIGLKHTVKHLDERVDAVLMDVETIDEKTESLKMVQ